MYDLAHEVAKRFERDLRATLKKEEAQDEYLPQEDFKTCGDRGDAIIFLSLFGARRLMQLAIAHHEIGDHGLDMFIQERDITAALEDDQTNAVAARSWWCSRC